MDISNWNILCTAGASDVEVKKSHFIGELKAVKSEDEAREFIASVRKRHYDARHHCFAMRIGTPDKIFERSGDDGEPQGTAGKPMLDILKGAGLCDVCAVVTRYFGGTLLGTGGLVRAYSDSLKAALSESVISSVDRGIRLSVKSGYSEAEKIKRLAIGLNIPSDGEEYAEDCTLYYIVKEDMIESFMKKVNETSMGKAVQTELEKVLFYGDKKPQIYKVL